jgi:hypothetical protein
VLAEQVAGRVRSIGRDAAAPRNRSRLVVGAGLAGVLLLVAIAAWSGWFSGDGAATTSPPGESAGPASAAATPLIDAQEYRDRGITVNVPKAWNRTAGASYVDYTDPASARWVRINIEPTGGTAMKFLQNAETGLRNPSRCPSPFTEVGLREATLAGEPGAELEYTCGEGDGKRHGIWRAVVRDGNAYHFYLTVPDSRFAEARSSSTRWSILPVRLARLLPRAGPLHGRQYDGGRCALGPSGGSLTTLTPRARPSCEPSSRACRRLPPNSPTGSRDR